MGSGIAVYPKYCGESDFLVIVSLTGNHKLPRNRAGIQDLARYPEMRDASKILTGIQGGLRKTQERRYRTGQQYEGCDRPSEGMAGSNSPARFVGMQPHIGEVLLALPGIPDVRVWTNCRLLKNVSNSQSGKHSPCGQRSFRYPRVSWYSRCAGHPRTTGIGRFAEQT